MTCNIENFEKGKYFCEPFYYGNRLKGDITVCEKEKAIAYHLYTHNKKVVDSGMFLFDDSNKLQKYQQVVSIVRDYLNNCKY